MTPRSDHDEDMSMEEILASIRRFVTDNPSEDIHAQKAAKGALREPRQDFSKVSPVEHHKAPEEIMERSPYRQPQTRQPSAEIPSEEGTDILELSEPFIQPKENFRTRSWPQENLESPPLNRGTTERKHKGYSHDAGMASFSSSSHTQQDNDPSILTLTNPIDPVRREKPAPAQPGNSSQADENLGSAHTVVSSAGSLARLAQTAKSVPGSKVPSTSSSQRNMTLDQLIQDMIRPMIKQWIDTHLPSLVEEMVAKEIRRITQHLE